MNGRRHRSSIVDVGVVAVAISALALALSGGLTHVTPGGPATVAATASNDGGKRTAAMTGTRTDRATGAPPASAVWRTRYDALKERQIAALDAAALPRCGGTPSPRERYLTFKLHHGDQGSLRSEAVGCDA